MSKESSKPFVNVPAGAGHPQYSYHPVSYQTIAVPVPNGHPYRRSPLRRFIVAFLAAVGVFTLLKVALRDAHYHHGRGHRGRWGHHWDIPSNMNIDRCVGASEWLVPEAASTEDYHIAGQLRSSAEAKFDIPLTPETVLVLSRHRQSSWFSHHSSFTGSLDITTSSRLNDTAQVIVTTLYGGHKHNSNMDACLMTGEDGEAGVGIFTKRNFFYGRRDASVVKVRLVLPENKKPLQLKGLTVDLPNFTIDVGALQDAVEFKSVSVTTTNAAVRVKSLSADDAKLHTSNGVISAHSLVSPHLTLQTSNAGISGTFNTSASLQLITSNAPITVNVNLESAKDASRPTRLTMRTSNRLLEAKINLVTPASKGGLFRVSGMTSNAPLTIAFLGSPQASELDLSARTSNAAAEVKLHSAYEGQFNVRTSQYSAAVTRKDGEKEKDNRRIEYDGGQGGHGLKGYVYSKEAGKERGKVGLTTSNAPAVLFV
ncbi:hypothetical protein C8R43DRAFT_969008 [Mycena crocata]|nr:hypothetical protein C8R43DRAFT_969008 [Mycena crocata]